MERQLDKTHACALGVADMPAAVQSTRKCALLERLALAELLCSPLILAAYWSSLPPILAMHVQLNGIPDGFGRKENLLVLPASAVISHLSSVLIGRLEPIASFALLIVRIVAAWIIAVVTLVLCSAAVGAW